MPRDESRGTCEFIARRYRHTRLLLLALVFLLTLGLYGFTFDPLPMSSPPGGPWQESASLADRLGDWMAYLDLGSGPLAERPYDFLVFWFTALSLLVYLRHFERLRRVVRALGDDLELAPLTEEEKAELFLPWLQARFFLLFYPALTAAAMIASPWTGDVSAQKVFYLLVNVHILITTSGLFQRELMKHAVAVRPRYMEFGFVLLLLFAPVTGWGGWLLLIFFGFLLQLIRTFAPGWLKLTIKQPMA